MNKKIFFLTIVFKWKAAALTAFLITLVILGGSISVRTFSTFTDPLDGKSILIDPGHGGVDGGTSHGNLLEKDINLKISLYLQEILLENNAEVGMTRQTDIALDKLNNASSSRHKRDLYERLKEINSGKYNAFASIHVNHINDSRTSGPLVFYSSRVEDSKFLAECIQKKMDSAVAEKLHATITKKPLKSDYYVLVNARIPGVIVEVGYISNSLERSLLQQPDYLKLAASAIAEGIGDFYRMGAKPAIVEGTDPIDILPDLEDIPEIPDLDTTIVER